MDGLIFTPYRGSYLSHQMNLKWKEKHSIDVRILYNRRDDFTEFYPNAPPFTKKDDRGNEIVTNEFIDRETNAKYYKNRITTHDTKYKNMNLVNSRGVLGMRGRIDVPNMRDIVEVEFLPGENRWVYLRKRPDKEVPNSYRSVKSVLDAIVGNITIDELEKLKFTPSPYEKIGLVNKGCFTEIGFNFAQPDVQSYYPVCKFYTYAYKTLIGAAKSILVLGGDKCIFSAVSEMQSTVIEKNCLEVYGCSKYEGYTGLLELSARSSCNIIWGDPLNLSMLSGKKYDVIFISSVESLLYNAKTGKFDKKRFDTLIKYIKQFAKTVIGIYLSGDRINSHLANMKCVLLRDSELNPMYKLLNKKIKGGSENSLFTRKPQMVEIRRMRDNFTRECQPLMFDADIAAFGKALGKKIKCNSIKSIIPNYQSGIPDYQLNGKLSEYDCIMADITRWFII